MKRLFPKFQCSVRMFREDNTVPEFFLFTLKEIPACCAMNVLTCCDQKEHWVALNTDPENSTYLQALWRSNILTFFGLS